MKPERNKEWMCRHAMWNMYPNKQGDKHFICALKKFQVMDLTVTVPVRGCWPDDCLHNPASPNFNYDYCLSSKFQENNRTCPHAKENTWCSIGTCLVNAKVTSNYHCNCSSIASTFRQIGVCPYFDALTPEEVAAKLKTMANNCYRPHAFFGKGTNLYKWVKLAEEYAGVTPLTNCINRWLEQVKERKTKWCN